MPEWAPVVGAAAGSFLQRVELPRAAAEQTHLHALQMRCFWSTLCEMSAIIFIDGPSDLHQEKLSVWGSTVRRDGSVLCPQHTAAGGQGVQPCFQMCRSGGLEQDPRRKSSVLGVGRLWSHCWGSEQRGDAAGAVKTAGDGGDTARSLQCSVSGQHLPQHTLCFSRVLVNGCSSVPPVKYNLLKGFGALIRTQRVVPFITMAMARPRARGGPVCENE